MKRALVVDDNDEIRDFFSLLLSDLGFTPTMASSGRAGLRALEDLGTFHVALVDLFMPDMDGFAFIRAVRESKAFKKVPILVATSSTYHPHVKEAMKLGANEFLLKPFSLQDLRKKLKAMGALAN
jgi:CheY-like chemotaxis protein